MPPKTYTFQEFLDSAVESDDLSEFEDLAFHESFPAPPGIAYIDGYCCLVALGDGEYEHDTLNMTPLTGSREEMELALWEDIKDEVGK